MEQRINNLIENWQKKNISGFYCHDKNKAVDKILEMIPLNATIGMSGSQTLDQLKIIEKLSARGNKVINQYQAGLSKEESLNLRKQGVLADYYLASANAISEEGEMVFFSAFGNRTAGISFAKNCLVICGINKITLNLAEALKRARELATPLNCKRLNWNTPCLKDGVCNKGICLFPEYKRMCCQILIIEAEAIQDRLKVILVGEKLGF